MYRIFLIRWKWRKHERTSFTPQGNLAITTLTLRELTFAQQNSLNIPDAKFKPNLSMNMENMGRNSLTTLSKVWQHWAIFQRIYFWQLFLKNSHTEFDENVKRQTSRSVWSSNRAFFSYFVYNALYVTEYRAMERFMRVH